MFSQVPIRSFINQFFCFSASITATVAVEGAMLALTSSRRVCAIVALYLLVVLSTASQKSVEVALVAPWPVYALEAEVWCVLPPRSGPRPGSSQSSLR